MLPKIRFDYEDALINMEMRHQQRKENLAQMNEIAMRLVEVDFPVMVEICIDAFISGYVAITPEADIDDHEFAMLVATCVKHFHCKFSKQFSDVMGEFRWKGSIHIEGVDSIDVWINKAPKGNCTIRRIKQTQEVERWVSDCQGEAS